MSSVPRSVDIAAHIALLPRDASVRGFRSECSRAR